MDNTNQNRAQINLEGAIALVTGANRGIGAAFVQELLAAGATRVYAAARDTKSLVEASEKDSRIVPVELDITSDASVRTAAEHLGDVTLLINNAGALGGHGIISAPDLSAAHTEMEVNYFGLLRMVRAFAPVLVSNGGGTIINILSLLSRVARPSYGGYSASKAAAYSLTQSVRAELRKQGTHVIAVMPSFVDTDMVAEVNAPKIQPIDVVSAALAAVGTDQEDVYPGETATNVSAWLLQDPKAVERYFAQSLPE